MDEHATDPDHDPQTQPPREDTTRGAGAGGAHGSASERIGQQDPASDGEDPSPS